MVKRALAALVETGLTRRQAILTLLDKARAGDLPQTVLIQLTQARDERGPKSADGLVSVATLNRWFGSESLLPKPSSDVDLTVRTWHAPLFALLDRPQKPTLRWAHDRLVENWHAEWEDPAGSGIPNYDRARRAKEKRSELDKLKGVHTGSALRSKLFYQHRRYDHLAPGSEIHADGWNTHFRAPHPVTGEFVTYEVWHAHDTHTRWVPPFAVGLSESSTVINECLRQTVMALGLVAIFQTDHTRSIKNHAMLDEVSGLADRLGVEIVHPVEVGNSQANGMAENFNTWLDRESRELATYQHPDRMDSGTFVRVRRMTNAMVRAADAEQRALARQKAIKTAKGLLFDSYAQAIEWLEAKRQKWNTHEHRGLPKIKDAATGRMRHSSPQEALDAARADGWQPLLLTPAELADAFRPHYRKKVTRGTVTPYSGMRYRDRLLDHILGEEVLVAVDEDDWRQVWVKDLQGRLICTAQFVEAVGSRCESLREHAERKRADARIKLRENQIASIAAEQVPPALEMDDGSNVLDGLTSIRDLVEVERAAEAKQADPTKTYLARKEAEKEAERKRLDAESDARLAEILANNRHTGDEDDDTPNFESAAG